MSKIISKQSIELLANKFRSENGSGLNESMNLKSLLQKLNILTLFRPMSEDFSGLACKSSASKFMLINSNMSVGRQHFTIAHELFHLYQETNLVPHVCNPIECVKTPSEKNADAFAAAFLMPENGICEQIPNEEICDNKKITVSTIIRLEQYFEVSRSAILYRLKAIGIINQSQVETFNRDAKSSAQTYGYDTSLYNSGNENLTIGDYGIKAKKLFDLEKISEGHLLELMKNINN